MVLGAPHRLGPAPVAPPACRGPPLNQSKYDAHNTVGIPTIYLIEKFDKFEFEGPTVGPAKMIQDAKNQTIAHPLVKQPKMRKYLPDLVIFFKLAKVVIS